MVMPAYVKRHQLKVGLLEDFTYDSVPIMGVGGA